MSPSTPMLPTVSMARSSFKGRRIYAMSTNLLTSINVSDLLIRYFTSITYFNTVNDHFVITATSDSTQCAL